MCSFIVFLLGLLCSSWDSFGLKLEVFFYGLSLFTAELQNLLSNVTSGISCPDIKFVADTWKCS